MKAKVFTVEPLPIAIISTNTELFLSIQETGHILVKDTNGRIVLVADSDKTVVLDD